MKTSSYFVEVLENLKGKYIRRKNTKTKYGNERNITKYHSIKFHISPMFLCNSIWR